MRGERKATPHASRSSRSPPPRLGGRRARGVGLLRWLPPWRTHPPAGYVPCEARSRPRDFARTTLRERHRPVVRALAEAIFTDAATSAKSGSNPSPPTSTTSSATPAARCASACSFSRSSASRLSSAVALRDVRVFPHRPRARPREDGARGALTLALAAYKAILSLVFFEHPAELADVGYTEPAGAGYARCRARGGGGAE